MLIGSDECPDQEGGLGAPCPQNWLHPALWLLSLASRLNSVLCWKKVHAAITGRAAPSTYVCKKRVVYLHYPIPAGKTSVPKTSATSSQPQPWLLWMLFWLSTALRYAFSFSSILFYPTPPILSLSLHSLLPQYGISSLFFLLSSFPKRFLSYTKCYN